MEENLETTETVLGTTEELSLRGVLTHALPASLGTPSEPFRYTVPATFNRRPLPREIAMIESEMARLQLMGFGYGGVTLTVADLRLEIGETNLAELKSGLATRIGAMLHDASVAVAAQEANRVADLTAASDREVHRADLIAESASEVRFL